MVKSKHEYSIEDLKRYIALPARKKLEFFEQMNLFFAKVMISKSKKIWKELKLKGF